MAEDKGDETEIKETILQHQTDIDTTDGSQIRDGKDSHGAYNRMHVRVHHTNRQKNVFTKTKPYKGYIR